MVNKAFSLTAFAAAAFALPLFAREAKVFWDPNPEPHVDGYRVYQRPIGGGDWEALTSVPTTQTVSLEDNDGDFKLAVFAVFEIPDDASLEVCVTAFEVVNEDQPEWVGARESDFSKHIELNPKPSKPTQLYLLTDQVSPDLTNWTTVKSQVIEIDGDGKKFFRTIIEPVEPTDE